MKRAGIVRTIRWCSRTLIVLISVAMVAGLASTVPAQAAKASSVPGTITLTIDPGPDPAYPSTEADVQDQINYINDIGAGSLGGDLERLDEETVPTLPSGSQPVSPIPDFTGTLSATADGGGISMTIPSDEATVYTASQWYQVLGGLAYAFTWLFVRMGCVAASNFIPFIGPIVGQVICAVAAGVAANAARTAVMNSISENLGDSSGWAGSMVSALVASLPSGAWEAGINNYVKGVAPSGTTPPPPPSPDPDAYGMELQFYNLSEFFGDSSNLSGLSGVLTTTDVSSLQSVGSFFGELAGDLPVAADVTTPPTSPISNGTCDAYMFYDTPCAGAYSTTHALYRMYDGPLYQVTRASDGQTQDIGVLSPGGYADASAQESFCAGTTCTITKLYDQSPGINDLTVEGPGGTVKTADRAADAAALPVTAGASQNPVYGLDIEPGTGYRDNNTQYIATKGEPEGMYMVASGTHVNSQCCFDFGNAESDSADNGAGHMDAVNLAQWCGKNNQSGCVGEGPWVEADLENGQWLGGEGSNSANTGLTGVNYATAMLNNDGKSNFELEGGNGQSGGLTTYWDGNLPPGYTMDQEGGIVLGTGGDNSNADIGSFFEGAMTVGYPSAAADAAVQGDIVATEYKGSSNPIGFNPAGGDAPSAAGPAVVHTAGAPSTSPGGYSSVFTVDAANGHLQENYLPAMGDNWSNQDLSDAGGDLPGTPPVMPGTTPVALVHCGYTSVYTVDAASGDLQETYLPAIGGPWHTQNLSDTGGTLPGTPPTDVTPTAVFHTAGAPGSSSCDGYTSVYTVNRTSYALQETYLPNVGFPGDGWATQTLPAPPVQPGTSPVAVVHCGYTSVYTVDQNHHLQETYLNQIGTPGPGAWKTQDLSGTGGTLPGTPQTVTTPVAVVHTAGAPTSSSCDGYTSVYTVNDGSDDLQETYLPNVGFPGDAWATQTLPAPPVAPGTAPAALVHSGYTSVYTVDRGSYHLQETYLNQIGKPGPGAWTTQDLSDTGGTLPGTPPTDQTPIVLLHPDTSGNLTYASVYTINQFDNDLQETFLQAIGDKWQTQDLSYKYQALPVMGDASPTASWSLAHDGRTSVYTISPATGDLMVSYLTAMGASWQTQDLTATGGADKPMLGTEPVAVTWDGHVTVFTIGTEGHVWETYLSADGAQWTSQDLTATAGVPVSGVTPTAVFHDGYVSVYTVADSANADQAGDLWETFLPLGSASWQAQDLSVKYKTPTVAADTSPVALYHDGYTSVFTADYDSSDNGNDLQETFLPSMGDGWLTHDLTQIGGAPQLPDFSSPTALYHSGYTSVYELDSGGRVWETYLPAIGDSWTSQDLTANYQVPNVPVFYDVEGTEVPVPSSITAVYHSGYASIFTLDRNADVHESFLPAMGDSWQTQDLTTAAHIPSVSPLMPLSALVHYDANGGLTYTSLFTLNTTTSPSLQETFLQRIGDNWMTQPLPS